MTMAICVCVLSCDHCTELVSVYVSHYDIIDIMYTASRQLTHDVTESGMIARASSSSVREVTQVLVR